MIDQLMSDKQVKTEGLSTALSVLFLLLQKPVSIDPAVYTGCMRASVLVAFYTHNHKLKHIFMLKSIFFQFTLPKKTNSDCVLGSECCQTASSVDANGGLKLLLLLPTQHADFARL